MASAEGDLSSPIHNAHHHLGVALIGVALLVPYAGGAQQIVLTITALLLPPLMAPTVWGLHSSRIGLRVLFVSAAVSFLAGLIAKFAMAAGAPLGATTAGLWVQANPRMADVLIGTLLPNIILAASHFTSRTEHPGWIAIERRAAAYRPSTEGAADHGSGKVVSVSLAGSGLLMLALIPFDDRGQLTLGIFAAAMLLLALMTHLRVRSFV